MQCIIIHELEPRYKWTMDSKSLTALVMEGVGWWDLSEGHNRNIA